MSKKEMIKHILNQVEQGLMSASQAKEIFLMLGHMAKPKIYRASKVSADIANQVEFIYIGG